MIEYLFIHGVSSLYKSRKKRQLMLGIISDTKYPAFNLATEEYLLKELNEDIFFLYINEPSIIVGKHQNALAEINLSYTQKHNIPVFRRMSGGGTVFHDNGNLNFCFITNEKEGNLVDFDKHSTPIVKALEALNLKVSVGKRHDLSINGKKITGTASHVYRHRAMHHGTLLFDADLTVLNKCLSDNYSRYATKGVRSVRSTVTNISEHLGKEMSMQKFTDHIYKFLLAWFPDAREYKLSESEKKDISLLAKEKYETWEWNYGYSPVYEIERSILIDNIKISSHIKVEKGLITELKFTTNDLHLQKSLDQLSQKIIGTQHNRFTIEKEVPQNIKIDQEDLLSLLF